MSAKEEYHLQLHRSNPYILGYCMDLGRVHRGTRELVDGHLHHSNLIRDL